MSACNFYQEFIADITSRKIDVTVFIAFVTLCSFAHCFGREKTGYGSHFIEIMDLNIGTAVGE